MFIKLIKPFSVIRTQSVKCHRFTSPVKSSAVLSAPSWYKNFLKSRAHASRIARNQFRNSGILRYDFRGPALEINEKIPKVVGEMRFGIHPVELALRNQYRSCYALAANEPDFISQNNALANILQLAKQRNIPIQIVDLETLKHFSGGRPHQGICLDTEPICYELIADDNFDVIFNRASMDKQKLIYLDGILDPMNFGAILRSCCYFGTNNIIVQKGRRCPLTPVVNKASSGLIEFVNLYEIVSGSSFLEQASINGFTIVGSGSSGDTEMNKSISLDELVNLSKNGKVLLVVGNEGTGISYDLIKLCKKWITIEPVCGMDKESLNVSVATAILLHSMRSL